MNNPIAFEIEATIARPIGEVFEFLSDYTNMPRWNYYILSVEKTSTGITGKGTEYIQRRPHDVTTYRIVEFLPTNSVSVALQPPAPNVVLRFDLEPAGASTRLQYTWSIDLRGYKMLGYFPEWLFAPVRALASRILLSKTKPAVEQNVSKLKTLLEAGQVTLQDGRIINHSINSLVR